MQRKLRVFGLEANIGSMLWPFKEAGHTIVGLYDSRGIVNATNFKANFPESSFITSIKDAALVTDIDIVMCQPSCSKFSALSRKDREDYDEGVDIWGTLDVIRPKMFFVESKLDYIDEVVKLPGYNYHIEWVSNYYYGNVQKGRNRLWVMGVREDIDWCFVPGEEQHSNTTESVISGLPDTNDPAIDHIHEYKPFLSNSLTSTYQTLDEAFAMLQRDGVLSYVASDGETKNRINRRIANRISSTTITGGGTWFHWRKKYPLTVRERARIQGFPDNFSFKGLAKTKKDKAVGKSIPMEFTRYLVNLLSLDTKELLASGELSPKKIVPEPYKLIILKKRFTS